MTNAVPYHRPSNTRILRWAGLALVAAAIVLVLSPAARRVAVDGLIAVGRLGARKPTPSPTGNVAPGFDVVRVGFVDVYLLRTGSAVVLFDAGLPDRAHEGALAELGVAPSDVTHCFLSHPDWYLVVGLPLLNNARVFLPAAEEPLVTGTTGRGLFGLVHNAPLTVPYELVRPGQTLTVGEATVEVFAAPGHTVGSAVYVVDGRWLVAGDAFGLDGATWTEPPWIFCQDPAQARETMARLAALPGIEIVATGHGGWRRTK